MSSLREQMQKLENAIARTRLERVEFIAKIQRQRLEAKCDVAKMRNRIKHEIAQNAEKLSKKLATFNRDNQRSVARTLRNLHLERIQGARRQSSSRQLEVSRNRRDIAKQLRQCDVERKASRREQKRQNLMTITGVKASVRTLRNETIRTLRSYNQSRIEAGRGQASRLTRTVPSIGSSRPFAQPSSERRSVPAVAQAIPSTTAALMARRDSLLASIELKRASALPLPPTSLTF